jgi:carboxyl-terminal processing protease
MRGKPGTKVVISVVREGWTEPKDIDLVREQIRVQSVKTVEMGDGIEYLKLRQFQEQSPHDMDSALDKFSKDGMKALILDLRNNPGGLLTAAVEVSEKFLEDGKLVVYTEGRVRNQNMRFSAHAKKGYAQMPMVILINQGSASASEIVAGALQDYGRAVIVGTQSFGKGSVQTIIPMNGRGALRLTTARYFTPSGRSIQGTGITPDVVVVPPKEQQAANARILHEADLKGALKNTTVIGADDKPTSALAGKAAGATSDDIPIDSALIGTAKDYQLSVALKRLRETVPQSAANGR